MADYADAKHRPHGIHTGEEPRFKLTRGPESIHVSLDSWGPQDNLFPAMYDALQANWGDHPSRTVFNSCGFDAPYVDLVKHDTSWEHRTGWCKLSKDEQAYVLACFAGQTLPQVLG